MLNIIKKNKTKFQDYDIYKCNRCVTPCIISLPSELRTPKGVNCIFGVDDKVCWIKIKKEMKNV